MSLKDDFKKYKRLQTEVELKPVLKKEIDLILLDNEISKSSSDEEYLFETQKDKNIDQNEIVGYLVQGEDPQDKWFINRIFASKNYICEVTTKDRDLSFGDAVELAKQGYKLQREGWNGKGMFIFLVPGSHFKVNRPPLLGIYEEGTEIDYSPHLDMKTASGEIVPWLASQSDVLSEDWCILWDKED